MVTASAGPSDGSLLRELVGDRGDYRGEEMEEDSGSELSELESSEGEMEVEEEWEGKGCGRPNFKRATTGARQQQSTQDFFRRGGDNIFDTPGKSVMGGALARSLTAATSCEQEGGTAETLNSAKSSREGGGKLDVGADDWAEEVANEVEMAGVAGSERSTTPTPTPARWPSATPVPVTPTKGNKRMAMGTPRPNRHTRPALRPMPAGFAAASALEQILAAIAGVEQKMEEKVTALEARMMEGMGALAADENEREARVAARLMADAEEREARLAAKLLTTEGIEREMLAKANWDIKQWTDLAQLMERRRVEIGEIKKALEGMAVLAAGGPTLHPRAGPAAVEPEAMEGVVATRKKEINDEVEEWSDMEGVERDGLFGSKHAPAPEEPVSSMPPGPTTEVKEKKEKEKGKGKAVQVAAPPAMGRAVCQRKRQAAVDEATTGKPKEPVAPIR